MTVKRCSWYGYHFPIGSHDPSLCPNNPAHPVNHPSHYTSHPSGVECITITRHFNFNRGNAIKYIWRAGEKDKEKEIEDIEKAIFYLRDEIARLSASKI